MLFDALCGSFERNREALCESWPGGARVVDAIMAPLWNAGLFRFDQAPHEFLPSEIEDAEFLRETFFLPFPTVAVEDTASLVVLCDTEPDQSGLSSDRMYIEVEPLNHVDPANYRDSERVEQAFSQLSKKNNLPHGALSIAIGNIRVPGVSALGKHKWELEGSVKWVLAASPEGVLSQIGSPSQMFGSKSNDLTSAVLRNVMSGVEEVLYINTPSRFVVEDAPKKMKDRPKKIPRSHQRPVYTLLKPADIQTRYGLGKGGAKTSRKQRPHVRRRHYRHLRSEKFRNKKGTVITIPAQWIGPSEITSGNRRYRVRLDL